MKFCIERFTYITQDNIDLSFLPAMSRRKLSFLDKAALCALNECFADENVNIVFASKYGEIGRLKKLVMQYNLENEVSPATFSAAVHNSAAGQFSLLKKIKESYNSISAEDNSFSAGFAESVITLCDNSPKVLFCYAEDEITEKTKQCAFACLLSKESNDYELKVNKPVLNQRKQCDMEEFINFLNNKEKEMVFSNGLFTLKMIDRGLNESSV